MLCGLQHPLLRYRAPGLHLRGRNYVVLPFRVRMILDRKGDRFRAISDCLGDDGSPSISCNTLHEGGDQFWVRLGVPDTENFIYFNNGLICVTNPILRECLDVRCPY
jgi:hypothetical protein